MREALTFLSHVVLLQVTSPLVVEGGLGFCSLCLYYLGVCCYCSGPRGLSYSFGFSFSPSFPLPLGGILALERQVEAGGRELLGSGVLKGRAGVPKRGFNSRQNTESWTNSGIEEGDRFL